MKNKITKEDVDNVLSNTLIKVQKYGDKTTVLMATLPNGFEIVVSSSCVDPVNYDSKIGEKICMEQLVNKIYELEGYRLQSKLNKYHKLKKCDSVGFTILDSKPICVVGNLELIFDLEKEEII